MKQTEGVVVEKKNDAVIKILFTQRLCNLKCWLHSELYHNFNYYIRSYLFSLKRTVSWPTRFVFKFNF